MNKVRAEKTPSQKLNFSIRTTAKCKYNAANRLRSKGKINFIAIKLFSFGLIFITLLQTFGVKIHIDNNILNMLQLFLSFFILTYSIIISSAQYELRAEKLNLCGHELKKLSRELDNEMQKFSGLSNDIYTNFENRYSNIIASSEDHNKVDYIFAKFDMKYDYKRDLYFWAEFVCYWVYNLMSIYLSPVLLLVIMLILSIKTSGFIK